MILIGSTALAYRNQLANLASKLVTSDIDIICTVEEMQGFLEGKKPTLCYPINKGRKYIVKLGGIMYEFEPTWEGTTGEELAHIVYDDHETMRVNHPTLGTVHIPSIHVLYALKMSHRFKKNSIHFLKTMHDIQFLRRCGAELKPCLEPFYNHRMAEQTAVHPKLNVLKEEFFTENFEYVYDHDSIHEAIKHLEHPAYWYFKPKDKPVMTDRKMFDALPESTKLLSVLEEAYVLALERSQIPFDGQI